MTKSDVSHTRKPHEPFINREAWARDLRILASLAAFGLAEYFVQQRIDVGTSPDKIRGALNLLICAGAWFYYVRVDKRRHGMRVFVAALMAIFLIGLVVIAVAERTGIPLKHPAREEATKQVIDEAHIR
jgi:hypothetical protein